VIEEQLAVGGDEVVDSADMIVDLGADSLDIVETVMALEEEFKVEIDDDAWEKAFQVPPTVGGIVRFMAARLNV
jgi:acyl carrier protein